MPHIDSPAPSIKLPNGAIVELLQYAQLVERQFGYKTCHEKVEIGDEIRVGSDISVLIDRNGLNQLASLDTTCRNRGDLLSVSIRSIFDHLLPNIDEVEEFFAVHGSSSARGLRVPLSKFLDTRTGNCATMGISFQLMAQLREGVRSFFVQGTVRTQDDAAIHHAWNITLHNGTAMLADVALAHRAPFEGICLVDGYPLLRAPQLEGFEYCLI